MLPQIPKNLPLFPMKMIQKVMNQVIVIILGVPDSNESVLAAEYWVKLKNIPTSIVYGINGTNIN